MPALPTLSVSRVVAVSVTLTPAGAQAQSLSNMLLLGTSAVIDTTERFRIYTGLAGVAADFGLNAEEYKGAVKWFSQSPQPTSFIIGRWVNAASQGGLRGATLSAAQQAMSVWNAITTGAFAVQKNGAAAVQVTGLNFSGAANLNAVAALIQASANMAGTTVVWNSNFQRFEFASTTAGATSAISFLVAPGSGVDISATLGGQVASGGYLFQGQAAESAVSAVQLMDFNLGQQWYGLAVPSADISSPNTVFTDRLAIAAYIEGTDTKHTYWVTIQDPSVLNSATSTDLAFQLQQLGYKRTYTQYSSSDPQAAVSAAARILTTNFTGNSTVMTLKFKQEPGVAAENVNVTQATALEAKNCNIFVWYNNNTAIIEQGVMANGTFVDIVTGTDWLAVTIQTNLYNLLYTSPTKIPQTDEGQQLLTTACEAVCAQGVINGLLAPGVWNSNGFGLLKQGDFMQKGFYVYSASFNTQSQTLRVTRVAMPIQIAAKLAGAIHHVDVAITVNQ